MPYMQNDKQEFFTRQDSGSSHNHNPHNPNSFSMPSKKAQASVAQRSPLAWNRKFAPPAFADPHSQWRHTSASRSKFRRRWPWVSWQWMDGWMNHMGRMGKEHMNVAVFARVILMHQLLLSFHLWCQNIVPSLPQLIWGDENGCSAN